MNYWISFPLGAFSSFSDALEFVVPFIRTPILSVVAGKSYPDGSTDFDIREVAEALDKNRDKSFALLLDGYDLMSADNKVMFLKAPVEQLAYFAVTLDVGSLILIDELFVACAGKGLTFGYKYDFQKAFWQSVDLVNTYESHKRSYAHLKTYFEPGVPPVIGHKVDISDNPGRQRLTYSMKLMAAPEMWFGPGCWAYFDRQRVASFPDAEEVRWMGPDLLYVRLFDGTVPDYEADAILHLQERFREWSGMDEAVTRLEGMLGRR